MNFCWQPERTASPSRFPALVCLLFFLFQTVVVSPVLLARGPEPGEAFCRPWNEEGILMVDLEVETLFTDEVRETLSSGFTSTVATRLLLREAESGRQVAESRFTREVRFDVWDETYMVTTHSDQGTGRHLAGALDEVEEYCRRISGYRFCPLADLQTDRAYVIALDVEVVPISQEQLEQTKRWVEESGSDGEENDSRSGLGIFFGSIMNIFIGRSTGVDEDRFSFVTAPFSRDQVVRMEEAESDE